MTDARHHRQRILAEVGEAGQRRLERSSVAIVGVGGLGSPVALYLAARALRAPGSLVHGTKVRCILAMLLATAQIVTWALIINLIVTETRTVG